MKTVFLTSSGLKNSSVKEAFIKIIPKKPSETKIAYILTASKMEAKRDFVDRDRQAMKEIGFQIENSDLEGKNETELLEEFKDKDIVYVQGGDTFFLLKKIKESGFDKVVNKLLTQGKIYFGVSAGTYVACPTIDPATWDRTRDNYYGLENLNAMNLVPFLIKVHYNREKYRVGLKEGITKSKYPVKILTDDQALLIQDDKVTLIGTGPEVTAEEVISSLSV